MPSIPMFWVISTALVLHGVIISRRGPTKKESMFFLAKSSALSKSQISFLLSIFEGFTDVSTTIIEFVSLLKKRIITIIEYPAKVKIFLDISNLSHYGLRKNN